MCVCGRGDVSITSAEEKLADVPVISVEFPL